MFTTALRLLGLGLHEVIHVGARADPILAAEGELTRRHDAYRAAVAGPAGAPVQPPPPRGPVPAALVRVILHWADETETVFYPAGGPAPQEGRLLEQSLECPVGEVPFDKGRARIGHGPGAVQGADGRRGHNSASKAIQPPSVRPEPSPNTSASPHRLDGWRGPRAV